MTDNKKIKIAQVVGNASCGGVISCVLNFYRNIDRDKFSFDFFTYGVSPFDEEIKSLGGNVFYIPSVLNYFKSVKAMTKLFRENGYDAVHAHLTTLSFVPLKAAKKAGIKNRICHAHSTAHISEKRWIVKATLKKISKVYPTRLAGCSRYACKWLYGKKQGEKAFVLHNAIDLNRFSSDDGRGEEIKKTFGFEGKKVVGHIGRTEFQKNPLFLAKIFKEVVEKNPDTVCVTVGDGSLAEKFRQKINSYGIDDRVFMLNETKKVEDYYKMFDVFVLPSKFEGLPLVAVEAQASGVPCLLSEKITRETDITGKCLFLPIKDPVMWEKEIKKCLEHGKYQGKTAVADAGYDITQEAKLLEKFYLSLEDEK